jgi:hypothetical protein
VNITPEYAASVSNDAKIVFRYKAREVFMVASSVQGAELEIWQDGELVNAAAGEDVQAGEVRVQDEQLYKLIRNPGGEEHVLEIRVKGGILEAFTFTFG